MIQLNDTVSYAVPPPAPAATATTAATTPAVQTLSLGTGPATVTLAETVQGSTTSASTTTVDELTFGAAGAAAQSAYGLILGYGILFLFLWAISKTRLGYATIYYGLVLLILFLVATQYRFISNALGNVAPAPASTNATSGDGGPQTIGHGLHYS